MRGGAKRIGVPAIAIAVLLLATSLAQAELTARGDLFVKFSGGIEPKALPRETRAPISVSVEGTVRTLSGERPPALRQMSIAINRGGRLDTEGLPLCRQSQIMPSSTEQALANCGPALVGRGTYTAAIAFPEQSSFPSQGRILAFNSIVDGHRAILAHVYGNEPLPITRIIVFRIRQRRGTYGTVLSGSLPASENRYGYVKEISLSLHREFTYRGRPHSYLSAACSAPPGFPGATFSFARASMAFSDGRSLASTLTRSCRVRGFSG
jgi:hypothetical protein